jgi:hypothetical protein
MELGRLRCGKGVSRALKKSPSSFWRNRRRIRRWAHGEMEGVPPMPAALGTGPQRQHECVRSGELDEATRSTRILASPISPGTHNRAEVATLLGQHVLVLWRLRRESVSTAGWPRRDPSRLINGRRGRPSAALVQPSITRYSARLKRLPHPASNVRTDECRLRVRNVPNCLGCRPRKVPPSKESSLCQEKTSPASVKFLTGPPIAGQSANLFRMESRRCREP